MSWANGKLSQLFAATTQSKIASSSVATGNLDEPIKSEDFVAWATTQPNAKGSLYLADVVRQYVSYMKRMPERLDIDLPKGKREIFACTKLAEFNDLLKRIYSAPNFAETNKNGCFRAGLKLYSRYLRCLENKNNDILEEREIQETRYVEGKHGKTYKYMPLQRYLEDNGEENVSMSFAKIENVLGDKLPSSAYKYLALWANTKSHPIAVAWMNAGYIVVEIDLNAQEVCFCKGEPAKQRKTRTKTVRSAMIELSNKYKGQTKTASEIIGELQKKYSFPNGSMPISAYVKKDSNEFPKLFERIESGIYECLGYETNRGRTTSTKKVMTIGNGADQIKIKHIMSTKFKNGFRVLSSIDFERFKNYYQEEYDETFTYNISALNAILRSNAVLFDDRAYVYDEDAIKSIWNKIKATNTLCICLDVFYNKYANELNHNCIFSTDMLKAFIEKNYDGVEVKWGHIMLEDDIRPFRIIKECFQEREVWTIEELQSKLVWLKADTIRQSLNGNGFFKVDTGAYTCVDNMDLPPFEVDKIKKEIENKLEIKDYVVANELDFIKLEYLNPHCSFASLRDAVYYQYLSNDYDKSWQIITRKGVKLRAVDILEQYCKDSETVSFDEINSMERNLNSQGTLGIEAAYNTMIRASEDLFVADNKVNFDIEKTDKAIKLYCHDDFIPLKSVTDFSLFPYCGYAWNLWLLESFVRRYSCQFKYDERNVNIKSNVGAIIKKALVYDDFDDIMALALAKSTCQLHSKQAGLFLFESGYIGWKKIGKTENKVLAKAKELRQGGAV